MHDLTGKAVLILATDGFEQSELEVPYSKLTQAGARGSRCLA
jgi:protease I